MTNRFGTTQEMVIQTVEESGVLYALAIDNKGLYLTQPERLQAHLSDPNRYARDRGDVAARLAALGLDPIALLNSNQHRVAAASGDAAKKVNPLKASKRAMKKK